jgi:hypothetical protein
MSRQRLESENWKKVLTHFPGKSLFILLSSFVPESWWCQPSIFGEREKCSQAKLVRRISRLRIADKPNRQTKLINFTDLESNNKSLDGLQRKTNVTLFFEKILLQFCTKIEYGQTKIFLVALWSWDQMPLKVVKYFVWKLSENKIQNIRWMKKGYASAIRSFLCT